MTFRRAASLLSLFSAALLGACDRPPTVELKEWTAGDHDGEQKKAVANAKQGKKGDPSGPDALVEITWRNQCVSCHGPQGGGDGPQGPMFKAADLTKPEWQAKVKDEDIAAAILNGKGRMPRFELSPEIVRGLVLRVRSFRGQ